MKKIKKVNYKLEPARGEFMRASRIVNIWFNQRSVIRWGHLTTAAIRREAQA